MRAYPEMVNLPIFQRPTVTIVVVLEEREKIFSFPDGHE